MSKTLDQALARLRHQHGSAFDERAWDACQRLELPGHLATVDELVMTFRESQNCPVSMLARLADRAAKRHQLRVREILVSTREANRDLTDDEQRTADAHARHALELNKLSEAIEDDEAALSQRLAELTPGHGSASYRADGRTHLTAARSDDTAAGGWVYRDSGRRANVVRGARFADHEVVADHASRRQAADQAVIGMHGSLGHLVRSMSTTSGSAIVPTVWAGDIIDRARNLAAVTQAGAEIIPMGAKTVQIGRLTADPTAAFRTEGSTVTASDPVFDNVTLTAKTMSSLVVGSMEWFQDADNVDEVVMSAIAKSIALTLDQQALYGGITTGGETGATAFNTTFPSPPNPTGILATLLAVASSSVLGGAANGTNQTAASFWNEIVDTIYQPRLFNETPNALLWSPVMAKQYAKAYDTTNQPLRPPPVVEQIQKYETMQLPASFTQGTSTTNMSDVFAGDFTQLIIGQRLDLTIQTLTERYAELGQVGIIAHWRGDIAPARPRAFSVYRYLKSN